MNAPDAPMDSTLLEVFRREVLYQCQFAALASQDLDAALAPPMDTQRVWMAVQQILLSTANLSKLLWGSTDDADRSRAPLREKLGVADDSPIRAKRLRNGFEHFDEQIDKWWARGSPIFVSRNVGPPEMIAVGDTPSEGEWARRLGHFDPETGEVTLWDRAANLRLILAEIGQIADRAVAS